MRTCEVMEVKRLCGKPAVKEVKLTYSTRFPVCTEHLRDFRYDKVIEVEYPIPQQPTPSAATEGK